MEFELVMGDETERFTIPVNYDVDWVLMVPITPSTCVVEEGLDGSVGVRVAFGINSYKVPDWE
jgi:hypothetical protein